MLESFKNRHNAQIVELVLLKKALAFVAGSIDNVITIYKIDSGVQGVKVTLE